MIYSEYVDSLWDYFNVDLMKVLSILSPLAEKLKMDNQDILDSMECMNKEMRYRNDYLQGILDKKYPVPTTSISTVKPKHNLQFIDGNEGDLKYWYYCIDCGTLICMDDSEESCTTHRLLCPKCSHLEGYELEYYTPSDKEYNDHIAWWTNDQTFNLWFITPYQLFISQLKGWYNCTDPVLKKIYNNTKDRWEESNWYFIRQQIKNLWRNRKQLVNYNSWKPEKDMNKSWYEKYYK